LGQKGIYSEEVEQETTGLGWSGVTTSVAGAFDAAWHSEARFRSAEPDLIDVSCHTWWVDRVGFVRIQWRRREAIIAELELESVADVREANSVR
jgi:hypothetical protein